ADVRWHDCCRTEDQLRLGPGEREHPCCQPVGDQLLHRDDRRWKELERQGSWCDCVVRVERLQRHGDHPVTQAKDMPVPSGAPATSDTGRGWIPAPTV